MRTDSGVVALHRDALAAVRGLLAGIAEADLGRPTPCAGWDVRTLVAHMVGQNRGFAAAIASGDAAADEYAATAARETTDLVRAWDESVDRLLAACAAADPERRVRLVEISADATFPASAVVRIQLLDTVVHTWDLATAVGLPYRPAPDAVELVAAVARSIPDGPARALPGAAFGPPVDLAGDDPWAATLAHLGRRP